MSGYSDLRITWNLENISKGLSAGYWVDEGDKIGGNYKNKWIITGVSSLEKCE